MIGLFLFLFHDALHSDLRGLLGHLDMYILGISLLLCLHAAQYNVVGDKDA